MKNKVAFLSCIALLAAGIGSFGANNLLVNAEENKPEPVLLDWLNVYDLNYTRTTEMNFSPDAYKELTEIQNKINFPFTQNRTTYFVDNGLYMTDTTEHVNAGYYSIVEDGHDQLYRYTLPEPNPSIYISSTTVPEGFKAVKQDCEACRKSCNDFFINMHHFRNETWANKFKYDATNELFVSTDENVLSDFLAFTASCYLNPKVGEEGNEKPYLTFKEAHILKNKGDSGLTFRLYVVDEDKVKLSTDNGLFSVAKVSAPNETKIPVLEAHLNQSK